jgi:alpha-D-xyloside xylohydrolase
MPYIYAQAKQCTEQGLPMVRALFVEFPQDPGAWLVDNEYMFGSDLLVAPMFEAAPERSVYLPVGKWIDYQSGQVYTGGSWQRIKPGPVQAVVLVRDGAVIPHIKLAQSTQQMDWKNLRLVGYSADSQTAKGYVCLPADNVLREVSLTRQGGGFQLATDPLKGKVKWRVESNAEYAKSAE